MYTIETQSISMIYPPGALLGYPHELDFLGPTTVVKYNHLQLELSMLRHHMPNIMTPKIPRARVFWPLWAIWFALHIWVWWCPDQNWWCPAPVANSYRVIILHSLNFTCWTAESWAHLMVNLNKWVPLTWPKQPAWITAWGECQRVGLFTSH